MVKGLTFQVKEFVFLFFCFFCYKDEESGLKASGAAECYNESHPFSSNDLLQEVSGRGGGVGGVASLRLLYSSKSE